MTVQNDGLRNDGVNEPQVKTAAGLAISRHLKAGVGLVALLVFGVGGWAANADIAGAVIAPGVLVVDSNVKKVQHPTGGVVGELWVRNGDRVEAGKVLLRLEDTVTRANLAMITGELDGLFARKAKLEAERDGAATVAVPAELSGRLHEAEVRRAIDGERRLFEMRLAAREGQKAQLTQRIAQLKQEIEGNLVQESANAKELALALEEFESTRALWEQKLMPIARYTELQRQLARLEGAKGQLAAATARLNGQTSEIGLQINQIDHDLASEVSRELRVADGRIGELRERRIAAEDTLQRIDVRAPQSGTVHESTVHTVGEVISPMGQPIMLIVPDADSLTAQVQVQPQDIDQIREGETAILRFSAFSQRSTPEVSGTVSQISANVSRDPATGQDFYTVRIKVPDSEIKRLGEIRLVPGMPVEAFMQTGERTVLSYIAKPIADQVERAFREH
ncbi:HlyD family type I secretion periplasmic adaptor subunit [Bosea caraganae]|uniref:Membrane fusion protein (MFP) family protein n=1 Tax=Bosea caraganae TaxID=2763117 RepID=A0A370LAX2_9HYPH|nr:HlyD family type I secretion periplasmic adaptor subunit [Bosea caraganae]RDJ27002.1 HlyD family type I secretion periplasmic adaptor subunit [Bosea caraganae]RDJ29018.1 HlyD family type I secretion periplasmic adaptor subunit [Bosea caraganae]